MNNWIKIGTLIIVLFVVNTSCIKELSPDKKGTIITSDDLTITLFADQKSPNNVFTFTTTEPWNSSGISAITWLKIEPSDGGPQNDIKLILSLEENFTNRSRNTTIIISTIQDTILLKVLQRATTEDNLLPSSGSVVELPQSGELKNILKEYDANDWDRLIIRGVALDANDFKYIRDSMLNLEFLNIKETKTTVLPKNALKNHRKLNTLELGTSVTRIGVYALSGTISLETIEMINVDTIGFGAFRGCLKLETIVMPDNLMRIESEAFHSCILLKYINIPLSVTYIGADVFTGCRKLNIVDFQNLKPPTIGTEIFNETSEEIKLYTPDKSSIEIYKKVKNLSPYINSITTRE